MVDKSSWSVSLRKEFTGDMPELFQDELFLWRNNSENITFHFLVFFLSGHWLRSIGYFSVGEMRSEPCQLFSFKPLGTRMTGEHMVLG